MDQWIDYLFAAILGVIEGLTEFLPVSSTGHLILAEQLMGAATPEPFKVMIQLGAVLAICIVYFGKIWEVVTGLPTRAEARRFAAAVIVAFIPAMILGALFHDFIKSVLFSPVTVSVALVVGGVLMLVAERFRPEPTVSEVDDLPVLTALKIGLFQCLALMPGVSRSGATIVGAMLLKVDRRAAAEFSFFLSMPTMLAAFAWDFWPKAAATSPRSRWASCSRSSQASWWCACSSASSPRWALPLSPGTGSWWAARCWPCSGRASELVPTIALLIQISN
jgi:undecaprenyl-diphosphatase